MDGRGARKIAGAFDGIDVGRSASPSVFEWQSQTYLIVEIATVP